MAVSEIKVCICGGGSLGHVCAAVMASQGAGVRILSGHPDSWSSAVEATDPDGKAFRGHLESVCSSPEKAVAGAEIVLLCVPGYLIEKTLRDIKPFIGSAAVGTVVSSTGFFFFAHDILGTDARLFGLQRVPYIARVKEYGRSALLLGYKKSLLAALENLPEGFGKTLEELLLTPVEIARSYLQVSLTNSNPILHTGRLYSLFKGRENQVWDHNVLFYREWTDASSQILIDMDREFFRLVDALGVEGIPTLLDYYESTDASSLTRKISSIPAFLNITSPMVQVPGGWKADFGSRYFTEDFPYGLRWIKELAQQNNIETPVIDKVYDWGMNLI
ncbi:MAG: NAD/NADP octopine/nopaline dehydrogenase family protein [Bacteroidales bacterium]|nr:NAD/NADP octopine/nopaline dehydrogenase family protein [Bacteroidales bacterium]